MSRRSHPYFRQVNRLKQADIAMPGEGSGRAPTMSADEQQGVLWQAIRERSEPA